MEGSDAMMKLPKNKARRFSASFLFVIVLSFAAQLRADQLPIQISEQEQGDWCWAASALSVLNRYLKYPGVDTISTGGMGQCVLANQSRSNTSIDCCQYPSFCNYVTPSLSQIEAILDASPYSMNATSYTRTLTNDELATQIDVNKRPVLAGLRQKNNPSGMKHMVVIIALDSSGENAIVMDPGNQFYAYYQSISLDDLRNGTVQNDAKHWQWYETIAIGASPPADARLRYSFMENEYNFVAPGNMKLGPSYTVKADSETYFVVPKGKSITLERGFTAEKGSSVVIERE